MYSLCLGSAYPFTKGSNGHLVLRNGDCASGLFQFTVPAASLTRRMHVAFFFTGYLNSDSAAGPVVEVLKPQALFFGQIIWFA